MSWDVAIAKMMSHPGMVTAEDVPAIGRYADVKQFLKSRFPMLTWENDGWGYISSAEIHCHLAILSEDSAFPPDAPVRGLHLSIYDGTATLKSAQLMARGLESIFIDEVSGEEIDLNATEPPSQIMAQRYAEQIRKQAKPA